MKYLTLLVVFTICTLQVSAIRFADDDALAETDSEGDAKPAAKPAAAANASANATVMTTLAAVTNKTYMDVTIDGKP